MKKNHFLQQSLLKFSDLGRLFGASEKAAAMEIKNLEQKGSLLGFRPVFSRTSRETETVTALIEVKIQPEREAGFDHIARRIYNFKEVISCYLVSGDYDLLVFVKGKSLQEVALFVSRKLSTIERVQGTQTHFMLKTYKEDSVMLEPEPKPERLKITP